MIRSDRFARNANQLPYKSVKPFGQDIHPSMRTCWKNSLLEQLHETVVNGQQQCRFQMLTQRKRTIVKGKQKMFVLTTWPASKGIVWNESIAAKASLKFCWCYWRTPHLWQIQSKTDNPTHSEKPLCQAITICPASHWCVGRQSRIANVNLRHQTIPGIRRYHQQQFVTPLYAIKSRLKISWYLPYNGHPNNWKIRSQAEKSTQSFGNISNVISSKLCDKASMILVTTIA